MSSQQLTPRQRSRTGRSSGLTFEQTAEVTPDSRTRHDDREGPMNVMLASRGTHPTSAPTEHFDSLACISSRDQHRAVAPGSPRPGHYLQLEGPGGALLIPLDGGVAHVGRGITAGLHLDDASISRRHAIIVPHDSGHRILDDRSLNGTFVNGRRVEQQDLQDGDVITIGRLELVYRERP
jgi:hypothetical protein